MKFLNFRDLEVFSYHIYCQFVDSNGKPKNPKLCKLYDEIASLGKEMNYKRIGTGAFLTEFGALDNSEGSANEVDNITGNADGIFNSWTYWQYKYFNDITTAAQSPDAEGFWTSEGKL